MLRWLLAIGLTVASAPVWAQPAPAAITDKAQAESTAGERRVATLAAQRQTLAQRYEDELRSIDRLKNQRASWRRDRELRASLSDSLETANQLAAATRDLDKATTALAVSRSALLAAIDSELATKPTAPRAAQLAKTKTQLVGQTVHARRIVLPNVEIDPLADPEDLDVQAAALRESEAELSRQIAGLDVQAKDLDEVAELRKQHDRAHDLDSRDDDTPLRSAPHVTSRGAAEDTGTPGVPSGGGGAGLHDSNGTPPAAYEAEATIVLADVVDLNTIDTLTRAQRSGDPAQRALAAHHAHDAVAARLEQLRKRRAEIEARAKQLRGR